MLYNLYSLFAGLFCQGNQAGTVGQISNFQLLRQIIPIPFVLVEVKP